MGVWIARLQILTNLTTSLRCCMMWKFSVLWIALNFWDSPNMSTPELSVDQNKHRLDPNSEIPGTDMIWKLTRGKPSIPFHAAILSLTLSAKKCEFWKEAADASQVYSLFQRRRKTINFGIIPLQFRVQFEDTTKYSSYSIQFQNFILKPNLGRNYCTHTHVAYLKHYQHTSHMGSIFLA